MDPDRGSIPTSSPARARTVYRIDTTTILKWISKACGEVPARDDHMPPGATRPGGLFLIQRLDAADQLGDLPAFLWNKTDSDAWLKMNAAVRRLAITLDLAGFDLSERLRASAIAFWESVHVVGQDEDGDVWSIGESSHEPGRDLGRGCGTPGHQQTNQELVVGRRVRRLLHEWDHAEQALLRSIDKSGE